MIELIDHVEDYQEKTAKKQNPEDLIMPFCTLNIVKM